MTSAIMNAPGASLAEELAETVRDHPAVLRLAGGSADLTGGFGVISTPLPGRRVTGVRVPDTGEAIEIAVVLRLDRPLTETVADLRERAAAVAGRQPVDITVTDVAADDVPTEGTPEGGGDATSDGNDANPEVNGTS